MNPRKLAAFIKTAGRAAGLIEGEAVIAAVGALIAAARSK